MVFLCVHCAYSMLNAFGNLWKCGKRVHHYHAHIDITLDGVSTVYCRINNLFIAIELRFMGFNLNMICDFLLSRRFALLNRIDK